MEGLQHGAGQEVGEEVASMAIETPAPQGHLGVAHGQCPDGAHWRPGRGEGETYYHQGPDLKEHLFEPAAEAAELVLFVIDV